MTQPTLKEMAVEYSKQFCIHAPSEKEQVYNDSIIEGITAHWMAGARVMGEKAVEMCEENAKRREKLRNATDTSLRVSLYSFHEECERDSYLLAEEIAELAGMEDA